MKLWAYTSRNKDLNVFKEFHVKVERKTKTSLKCIRSDNKEEPLVHSVSITKGMTFNMEGQYLKLKYRTDPEERMIARV